MNAEVDDDDMQQTLLAVVIVGDSRLSARRRGGTDESKCMGLKKRNFDILLAVKLP
jgi:hypothetical protein